ncbi:MAG: alpha/beta hydrolase [Pseudomonadota bacterium]
MEKSEKPHVPGRRNFLGTSVGSVGLLAAAVSGCGGGMDAQAQTIPAPQPVTDAKICLPGMPLARDYAALRAERMAKVTPEMKAIYDAVAAAPSIRQTGIATIRESFKRPANAVVPNGVVARNIEIPGPAGPIPARIWMPAAPAGPVGVYLSTHGGGWNFGNGMEYHDAEEGAHVLEWGCAVVRPDYRIAPEHKFPAAIEDCYAVLQYIGAHGASMGLDTTRIGIGGGCAGANIGTVVTMMSRNAGGTMPAFQFLWSPACDMRNNYQSHVEFATGYGLRADDADFVSQNYLRTREDSYDWRASPVLAPTLKGMPPALVWLGEWEILRDETMLYVGRMRDAGVTVHLIEGPQQGHGFLYLYPDTAYAKSAMPEINRLVRSYIGPEAKR